MTRPMSQIKSKFLFVYVLLARKRTGNISYVKNSLLCTCRQTNQCWGTHNKISRDHPNKRTNAEELTTKFLETIQCRSFSEWYKSPRIWWCQCDEWAREWCANTDPSSKSKCCLCPLSTSRLKPLYCPCIKASTCEKHHGYHARSYMAFKFSAKRLLVFKDQLGDNPVAREEMGRRSKLKLLCETCWAPRADCLSVFVDAFKVLLDIHNLNHSPSSMS